MLGTHAVACAQIPTTALNNGVLMPDLSLGTWQYDNNTAAATVDLALQLGFNHVDTASNYRNQVGVGRALARYPRSSYFLTTKVPGRADLETAYDHTTYDLYSNLKQLNLTYVDLVLVHYPPVGNTVWCGAMQEQWRALEDFYKSGHARAIGVSNYCPSSLKCILATPGTIPAVNQVQYHVGGGVDPLGIKSTCEHYGIILQSYSPLGDGTTELITGSLVSAIGKKHGKSGAQVSLRWVYENGVPLSTKSTSRDHLLQDLQIFDDPSWPLTPTEKAQLDGATAPVYNYSFRCSK